MCPRIFWSRHCTYCTCIIRVLYVYCTCIVRVLYVYCTCIVRVLYVYCTCIVRVLYVYCTCILRVSGYSGADMSSLCRDAALAPIRSIDDIENIDPNEVRQETWKYVPFSIFLAKVQILFLHLICAVAYNNFGN